MRKFIDRAIFRLGAQLSEGAGLTKIPDPTIRADDLFIITFPKSGTTWMAYLLANYLNLENSINRQVRITTIDGIIPSFPNISSSQDKFVSGYPGYRIFKCHEQLDHKFKNIVYVIRHPKDVMISYYKFCMGLGLFEGEFSEFLRNTRYGMPAWETHVREWFDESLSSTNFLLVKYENLHMDPVSTLGKIFNFFGNTTTLDLLQRAVELSSFDLIKKDEIACAYGGRSKFSDFSFFRKGIIGSKDQIFTSKDETFMREIAGDLMLRLDYAI